MLIALCGTPGVGKTSVAELLGAMGWTVISDKELIKEHSLFERYDSDNDEYIVDPGVASEGFKVLDRPISGTPLVLDGHMSYLAPADMIILLRVSPLEIRRRLSERGYPEAKIKDNYEAEALGYLLIKSKDQEDMANPDGRWDLMRTGSRLIVERDVTALTPQKIVEWVVRMVDAFRIKEINIISLYRPGKIDWLEEFKEWS